MKIHIVSLFALATAVLPNLGAAAAVNEYEGHDLAYYVARADYHPLLRNPLNYHPNDGFSERMAAIEALGHFGSNAVPKLAAIFADSKRTDAERWTAIDALGLIGPEAYATGPLLLAYATNAMWQGLGNSKTSAGKAIDALAAIRATNTAPELIALLGAVESGGARLDEETRASQLIRLINALGVLASPADAKAILPTLDRILAAPPATSAPASRANWTMSFYLQEYAARFRSKLLREKK